ncbi:MAG: UMP kinase [Sulfolobales archaeon]|nr:UMP kinase [Sulfolobales archaeon]MCX8208779.1 UMP kinase [Sulfolobales archaeon]MDW8010271.1 UMP kinase [Sulfolobales archaeon]
MVVKITGRVFDSYRNISVLTGISKLVLEMARNGRRFVLVAGGGGRAIEYIELGRKLGLGEGVLDLVGIEVSRVNALILASLLGSEAYLPIPRSIDEFMKAWNSGKVVVVGGLQPGQSTNAVAAVIAELVKADLLVNATDVNGVYDSDPKLNPQAKLLREIDVRTLERLLSSRELAGRYELFDRVALNVVTRSRIPLVFLSVYDVENIKKAIEGMDFTGTRVVHAQLKIDETRV